MNVYILPPSFLNKTTANWDSNATAILKAIGHAAMTADEFDINYSQDDALVAAVTDPPTTAIVIETPFRYSAFSSYLKRSTHTNREEVEVKTKSVKMKGDIVVALVDDTSAAPTDYSEYIKLGTVASDSTADETWAIYIGTNDADQDDFHTPFDTATDLSLKYVVCLEPIPGTNFTPGLGH